MRFARRSVLFGSFILLDALTTTLGVLWYGVVGETNPVVHGIVQQDALLWGVKLAEIIAVVALAGWLEVRYARFGSQVLLLATAAALIPVALNVASLAGAFR